MKERLVSRGKLVSKELLGSTYSRPVRQHSLAIGVAVRTIRKEI
jgi:hypothetical protein